MKKTKKKTKRKVSSLKIFITFLIASMIGGAIFVYTQDGRNAFFARSINDASYDCEDTIKSTYDDDLISMYYDDLSSRYEPDKHQYIIYYRISVKEKNDGYSTVKDQLAKCVVWEKLGYVSNFLILDI